MRTSWACQDARTGSSWSKCCREHSLQPTRQPPAAHHRALGPPHVEDNPHLSHAGADARTAGRLTDSAEQHQNKSKQSRCARLVILLNKVLRLSLTTEPGTCKHHGLVRMHALGLLGANVARNALPNQRGSRQRLIIELWGHPTSRAIRTSVTQVPMLARDTSLTVHGGAPQQVEAVKMRTPCDTTEKSASSSTQY